MATVKFFNGLENVLVVAGDDVYEMNRKGVTDLLDATSTTPRVYRYGLYDFTILWWNGKTGNASHNSWDPSISPRPMRGRIYVPGVPSSSSARRLSSAMYTLLHEVLHHWMVDRKMTVRGQRLPTSQDFVRQVTDGDISFPLPPMLGRQNAHWSTYWQDDGSVLDGARYSVGPKVGLLRRWDELQQQVFSFDIDGFTVSSDTGYSDLDLYGMGVKTAAECYPSDNGRFRWMEPRFVGPHGFRMGTMAAVRSGDTVSTYEFGFSQHYDRIVVARDGEELVSEQIPNFDPFSLPGSGLVFRIVLSDGHLLFDARVDTWAAEGCLNVILTLLGLPSAKRPDFDLFAPPLSSGGDYREWTRVHGVKLSKIDDVVTGVNSQRWESGWTDLTFAQPKLRTRTPRGNLSTRELDIAFGRANTTPKAWLQNWGSWQVGAARNFLPTSGTKIWRDSFKRLHLALPHRMWDGSNYVTVPPEEFAFKPPSSDGGARVLWKVPSDFFAFAVSAAPGFVLVVPWIGGGMRGKYLLGLEHLTSVSDVAFPDMPTLKRSPPPNNTYRAAHIIVAKDIDDVTTDMVEAVDLRRRCLDQAFQLVTGGRRSINSELEPS